MAFLEVKNLRKRFGDTEVLKGIGFTLEKGEVISVIGSSGNGKTTLLRCLNFLEMPESGSISVGGEEIFDAQKNIPTPCFGKTACVSGWCFKASIFSRNIRR